MDSPRRVQIHSSLVRPYLPGGVNRLYLFGSAIVSLIVGFTVGTLFAVPLAIVLFVVLYSLGKVMGKADPQLVEIFIESLNHPRQYLAGSHPLAKSASFTKSPHTSGSRFSG